MFCRPESLQKCADLQIPQFRMQALFHIGGECEDPSIIMSRSLGIGPKNNLLAVQYRLTEDTCDLVGRMQNAHPPQVQFKWGRLLVSTNYIGHSRFCKLSAFAIALASDINTFIINFESHSGLGFFLSLLQGE